MAIKHILVMPFIKMYDTDYKQFVDYARSQQMTFTVNQASKSLYVRTATSGKPDLPYYKLVAVDFDGTMTDLTTLANNGQTVTAVIRTSIAGDSAGAVLSYLGGQLLGFDDPYQSGWYVHTRTCPANLAPTGITNVGSFEGWFLNFYLRADNGTYGEARCIFDSVTIDGVPYPIEIGTKWCNMYAGVASKARQCTSIEFGHDSTFYSAAKRLVRAYVGDNYGKARLVTDLTFDHIVFEPLYCAFGYSDGTEDDGGIFVTNDYSQLSTYGRHYASGNTVYSDTFRATHSYAGGVSEFVYLIKVVTADGTKIDLRDWCILTGDSFSIGATVYKSPVDYGGQWNCFAGNMDFIFNTNYAPAWAQSPKTITATCNASTPAGRTWGDYFRVSENIGYKYYKGVGLGIFADIEGAQSTCNFRNQIVINSFTRTPNGGSAVAVTYEWLPWS